MSTVYILGAGVNEAVALTTNEWLHAHRHGETYWLYVVWGCRTRDVGAGRVQPDC